MGVIAENKYVQDFKKLRIYNLIQNAEEFKKFRRKSTFWKEITEAMSVRNAIRDRLINDPSHVVIDVGAGKGFLTTLTALMHPKSKVIAVDIDQSADRSHFSYLKNVEFVLMDIMTEDFEKLVRNAGEKVIMTGIHLCRELSERFIEVVNKCENVKKAVLMPCCEGDFPRERYRFIIDELGVYAGWCCYLQEKIDKNIKVRVKRDKKVLSPKNVLIIMERES